MPAAHLPLLETPRLRLCHYDPAHHFEVLARDIFGDAEVMRYAFAAQVMDRAAAAAFLLDHCAPPGAPHGMGVIEARSDARVLGLAGLLPCDALGSEDFELGFILATHAQGQGYAREIGLAQIAFGFTALRLPRVLGLAGPQNQASLKALERLGMQPWGEVTLPGRGTRLVRVALRPADLDAPRA